MSTLPLRVAAPMALLKVTTSRFTPELSIRSMSDMAWRQRPWRIK